MKKILLILILNICLLFSPPPKAGTTDPNGRYVSLGHGAGFFLNPDTFGFIFPAINPGLLFANQSLRQARPLFILMGSAAGYSVMFLTWPVHRQLTEQYSKYWRGTYPKTKILLLGNFYLGYLLLNMLILWTALYLFERIFLIYVGKPKYGEIALYFLMVFIASNPVTKAFFWTVHQQMFAFFTPLLCIYLLIWFDRRPQSVSAKKMATLTIAGGTLLLVYGNFILLLPALLFGFIRNRIGNCQNKTAFLLSGMLSISALFLLPTFCWIGILKIMGIPYYNFEIQWYHQVVWIPETWSQSAALFFARLGQFSLEYLRTMDHLAILGVFSLIVFITGKRNGIRRTEHLHPVLVVFGSFFLFYWLLGFYESRLTDSLIPVVICFWIFLLHQQVAKIREMVVLGGLALCWHLYVLLSYGPFY
ncbi:MAG TPA: hypothetical protein VG890_03855 [Puia sp.]|nr:hypothetical protein [Puia sp.]